MGNKMILGTKARYGVMAMVEMAGNQENQPMRVADLAANQEITVPYLEQIFKKLKSAGLVKSIRGPGGGYVLSRPASKINVYEVIEAVHESMKVTRCDAASEHGCMNKKARCITHHLWEGLEKQIYHYLSSVSLSDIQNKNYKSLG